MDDFTIDTNKENVYNTEGKNEMSEISTEPLGEGSFFDVYDSGSRYVRRISRYFTSEEFQRMIQDILEHLKELRECECEYKNERSLSFAEYVTSLRKHPPRLKDPDQTKIIFTVREYLELPKTATLSRYPAAALPSNFHKKPSLKKGLIKDRLPNEEKHKNSRSPRSPRSLKNKPF